MLVQDAGLGVLELHLDEQQQHQLGDVVGVVDAVVPQYVAEIPEFLDDVGVGHACWLAMFGCQFDALLMHDNGFTTFFPVLGCRDWAGLVPGWGANAVPSG